MQARPEARRECGRTFEKAGGSLITTALRRQRPQWRKERLWSEVESLKKIAEIRGPAGQQRQKVSRNLQVASEGGLSV